MKKEERKKGRREEGKEERALHSNHLATLRGGAGHPGLSTNVKGGVPSRGSLEGRAQRQQGLLVRSESTAGRSERTEQEEEREGNREEEKEDRGEERGKEKRNGESEMVVKSLKVNSGSDHPEWEDKKKKKKKKAQSSENRRETMISESRREIKRSRKRSEE